MSINKNNKLQSYVATVAYFHLCWAWLSYKCATDIVLFQDNFQNNFPDNFQDNYENNTNKFQQKLLSWSVFAHQTEKEYFKYITWVI